MTWSQTSVTSSHSQRLTSQFCRLDFSVRYVMTCQDEFLRGQRQEECSRAGCYHPAGQVHPLAPTSDAPAHGAVAVRPGARSQETGAQELVLSGLWGGHAAWPAGCVCREGRAGLLLAPHLLLLLGVRGGVGGPALLLQPGRREGSHQRRRK